MTEQTQEQWHIDGWLVADANGDIVANEIDSQRSLNLIAAAPDMEKALETTESYHDRVLGQYPDAILDEDWRVVMEDVRAALAKARGWPTS